MLYPLSYGSFVGFSRRSRKQRSFQRNLSTTSTTSHTTFDYCTPPFNHDV
jgi:hypothetical protein